MLSLALSITVSSLQDELWHLHIFLGDVLLLEGICFNRDMVLKIKNLIQISLLC